MTEPTTLAGREFVRDYALDFVANGWERDGWDLEASIEAFAADVCRIEMEAAEAVTKAAAKATTV